MAHVEKMLKTWEVKAAKSEGVAKMSRDDDQIYQMDVRWICAKWKVGSQVQPAQLVLLLVHVSSWQFNITKCHQFDQFLFLFWQGTHSLRC